VGGCRRRRLRPSMPPTRNGVQRGACDQREGCGSDSTGEAPGAKGALCACSTSEGHLCGFGFPDGGSEITRLVAPVSPERPNPHPACSPQDRTKPEEFTRTSPFPGWTGVVLPYSLSYLPVICPV
jgi:hypothetical protein